MGQWPFRSAVSPSYLNKLAMILSNGPASSARLGRSVSPPK